MWRGRLVVRTGLSWKDRDHKLATFSDDLLRDLAGNAFHSGCCAAVMLSVMCTYGIGLKRMSGAKVHALRLSNLFKGAALIDDDGGGSDIDLNDLDLWGDGDQ